MAKHKRKKTPSAGTVPAKTASPAIVEASLFANVLRRVLEFGPLFVLGVAPLVFYGSSGEFENVPKMAFLHFWILVLALIRIWQKKNEPVIWNRTPLDIPLLLFYAFCWISLAQAPNIYLASLHLFHYGVALVFFFFLIHTINDLEHIDRIIFTGALSVTIVSIIGILQYVLDISLGIEIFPSSAPVFYPIVPQSITTIPQVVPPASTFSNKNMAADFIAMTFPLCIGSSFLSARLWRSGRSLKNLCVNLFAGMLFLSPFITVLYALYTKTRAGWLAICAVLILVGILVLIPRLMQSMRTQQKKQIAMVLGICIALLLLVAALAQLPPAKSISVSINKESISDRFLSIASVKDSDTSQLRLIWWKNTLHLVKDHFWWGVGLQNFKIYYPLYHRIADKDWSFTDDHQLTRVHNDHLQMLAELGIFGFCAYLLLFAAFFWMFWKIFFKSRDEQLKIRAVFICLGVIGFIINASLCFPMERAIPPVYLFVFFGLMGVLYRSSAQDTQQPWRIPYQIPARICLTILVVAFFFSSVYFIRKAMMADRYFVEAINADQKGDIDDSNQYLREAKKAFSMYNSNISALLARNYTMQGKYEQAIEEYKETFRAHPNNTSAILNTGYCYLQMKKLDDAEHYFNWAIELMPDFEQAYNDLGIVYFERKDYDKASAYYKKAFAINPAYAEPHINLGNVYRTQKQADLAIKEYERALELKPEISEVRKLLGTLYLETGQLEKAQAVLSQLSKAAGGDMAEQLIMQGNIYQRQGKHLQSLENYQKALALKPNNPFIYYNIGLAQYYMQNSDQSEAAFKKAVSVNPPIAEAYSMLGQLYLRKKDDRGALEMFQKAVKVNPKLRDAHFNIAAISLRLGDYDRAVKAYKDTLALDPNYSVAHYNLATLYMDKGNNQEALYHFEKALKNPSPLIDATMTGKFIEDIKKKLNK